MIVQERLPFEDGFHKGLAIYWRRLKKYFIVLGFASALAGIFCGPFYWRTTHPYLWSTILSGAFAVLTGRLVARALLPDWAWQRQARQRPITSTSREERDRALKLNPQPIRIVIADDHPLFRRYVAATIQGDPGLQVVGEATYGDEAITLTLKLLPDILVLSDPMLRRPWPEALQTILSGSPTLKIILLTFSPTPRQIANGLQIGVRGFVSMYDLTKHFTAAIRAVSSGDYWIGDKRVVGLKAVLGDLINLEPTLGQETYDLTPRELELVGCILQGYSNHDIAKNLAISEQTVKSHLSKIFKKTGVSTRMELVLLHDKLRGSFGDSSFGDGQ
jgi:DNA-binding NarL/FixJ family response regulator